MIPIQLTFAMPPLVAGAPEIAACLRTLEAMWPGLTLRFRGELGGPGGILMFPLPDPIEWIAELFSRGESALLYGASDQPPISVSFEPSALRAQDGTAGARVTVWMPGRTQSGQLKQVLEAAGDALTAWYGWYMPIASGALISQLASKWPVTGPGAELLRAIPELSALVGLEAGWPASTIRIPSTIGWLNYWSKDMPSEVLFRPQDALGGAARTALRAWAWQLTADLFDVQRPDHAAALLDAYRLLKSNVAIG